MKDTFLAPDDDLFICYLEILSIVKRLVDLFRLRFVVIAFVSFYSDLV